jgi:hypothetical protein
MIKSRVKENGDAKEPISPALSNGLSISDKQEQETPVHPVAQAAPPKLAIPEPAKKLRFISTCYDTKLLWSQTKEHIRIKILLVGVTT